MINFKKNIFRSTQDSNPSFIIANNIFAFGSQTPSWITSKTASVATLMSASGSTTLDSIFLSSKYNISRMIGIFDTSTVVTLPISGTFDIYITENPSLIARTYYLIASNTDFVAGTILNKSDWDNFNGSTDNSATPISSVTVDAGQTGKIKFPLDSTSLNLIHANNNFSAYVIGENDKNDTAPGGNPPAPAFSFNSGLGVSGSGDCVLTLT